MSGTRSLILDYREVSLIELLNREGNGMTRKEAAAAIARAREIDEVNGTALARALEGLVALRLARSTGGRPQRLTLTVRGAAVARRLAHAVEVRRDVRRSLADPAPDALEASTPDAAPTLGA